MSTNVMLDIVTYLEGMGHGKRGIELFTPADQGAYENRPLTILIQNPSGQVPEITEHVDYPKVKITVAGAYGKEGERSVHDKAHAVYKELLLLFDETINGTLYLNIRAVSSPSHMGKDENERTVIEFDVEIIRYRGCRNGV